MEQIEEYIKIIIKEKVEVRESYEKKIENDRQLIFLLTLILELVPKQ